MKLKGHDLGTNNEEGLKEPNKDETSGGSYPIYSPGTSTTPPRTACVTSNDDNSITTNTNSLDGHRSEASYSSDVEPAAATATTAYLERKKTNSRDHVPTTRYPWMTSQCGRLNVFLSTCI